MTQPLGYNIVSFEHPFQYNYTRASLNVRRHIDGIVTQAPSKCWLGKVPARCSMYAAWHKYKHNQ